MLSKPTSPNLSSRASIYVLVFIDKETGLTATKTIIYMGININILTWITRLPSRLAFSFQIIEGYDYKLLLIQKTEG